MTSIVARNTSPGHIFYLYAICVLHKPTLYGQAGLEYRRGYLSNLVGTGGGGGCSTGHVWRGRLDSHPRGNPNPNLQQNMNHQDNTNRVNHPRGGHSHHRQARVENAVIILARVIIVH